MKKVTWKIIETIIYTCAFCNLFIVQAKAYIDPSATTYVIQAVAAAVIAIGACFTIFRHKIASLFKKNKGNDKKEILFKEENVEKSEEN